MNEVVNFLINRITTEHLELGFKALILLKRSTKISGSGNLYVTLGKKSLFYPINVSSYHILAKFLQEPVHV
jgi:hypothetical protein